MRRFSARFMEKPGACSPSRRVVSKIATVPEGAGEGLEAEEVTRGMMGKGGAKENHKFREEFVVSKW